MRIVIDTNVIASAIFFGGLPRELIEHLVKRELSAFASPEIINEYQETIKELSYKYSKKTPIFPLNTIISSIRLIDPVSDVQVCRDPDDDKFISCALDAKCVYIVSGDKDLLSIRKYKNIEILTVSEFLSKYR